MPWGKDPVLVPAPQTGAGVPGALTFGAPTPKDEFEEAVVNGVRGQINKKTKRFFPYPEPHSGQQPRLSAEEMGRRAEEIALARQRVDARVNLPKAITSAQRSADIIDKLIKHEGFGAIIGLPDPFKGGYGMFNVRGSKAADAKTLFDQIGGGAFLTGIQAMKGTGAISNKEGEAAEKAVTRMQDAMSENEFKAAAKEYIDQMYQGIQNMKAVATMTSSTPVASPTFEEGKIYTDKYGNKARYTKGGWEEIQ